MLRMSRDGGETSYILAWSLRCTKDLSSSVAVKLGVGEMIYRQYGTGGTTTLNNGNSTTVFALPTGTAVSTLFSVNTGVGFILSETLKLDLDLIVVNVMSGKRAFNTVLTLGYGLL